MLHTQYNDVFLSEYPSIEGMFCTVNSIQVNYKNHENKTGSGKKSTREKIIPAETLPIITCNGTECRSNSTPSLLQHHAKNQEGYIGIVFLHQWFSTNWHLHINSGNTKTRSPERVLSINHRSQKNSGLFKLHYSHNLTTLHTI